MASTMDPPEYVPIFDGAEWPGGYRPGGFHPIMPGDYIRNERYRIVHKLGNGGNSTVWLAHDLQVRKFVALKIGTALSSGVIESEIATLRALESSEIAPKVFEDFQIEGPNGLHPCYAMTVGGNSLAAAKRYDMFPLVIARAMGARLASIVKSLHDQGYCHGDLRLANVLVKPDRDLDSLSDEDRAQTFGTPVLRPISRRDRKPLTTHVPPMIVMPLHFSKPATTFTLEDAKGIMLSDFGEAFRPSTPDKRPRLGKDSHIPLYARAPEALFEPSEPMSFASDIWSLACAIWHVLGLSPLFSPGETRTDYRVAGFLETLEPEKLPQSWQQIWEREESVPGNSSLPKRPHDVDEDCEPPISSLFEEWTQQRRRKEGKPFEEAETAAILDLMKGMLKLDPNERWTIDQVLESDWMRKWALPALNSDLVSNVLDNPV